MIEFNLSFFFCLFSFWLLYKPEETHSLLYDYIWNDFDKICVSVKIISSYIWMLWEIKMIKLIILFNCLHIIGLDHVSFFTGLEAFQ